MNSRWIALLSLASLLPASGLVAQEAIQPGARVRVTAAGVLRPVTGTIFSVDSASITLRDAEGRAGQVIRFESVQMMEVARGSRSHAGTGALIGTLVGGAFGVWFSIGYFSDPDSPGTTSGIATVIAVTSAAGAALGGIVGLAIRSPRWEETSVPRVSLMPRPGGFVLSMSLKL